jgi:hypothetical protein
MAQQITPFEQQVFVHGGLGLSTIDKIIAVGVPTFEIAIAAVNAGMAAYGPSGVHWLRASLDTLPPETIENLYDRLVQTLGGAQ